MAWMPCLTREHAGPVRCDQAAATGTIALLAALGLVLTPVISLAAPQQMGAWIVVLGLISGVLSTLVVWMRRIRIHARIKACMVMYSLVTMIGLWASFNGKSQYNMMMPGPVAVPDGWFRWPAAMDAKVAFASTGYVVGLLTLGISVAALASSVQQAWPILVMFAVSAVVLCIMAIGMRSAGLTLTPGHANPASPFGWFSEHGQAGSYLIMGLFSAVGLFFAWARNRWVVMVGLSCLALILTSLVFINISEAAAGIGLLLLLVTAWVSGLRLSIQSRLRLNAKRYKGLTLVFLIALAGLVVAFEVPQVITEALSRTGWYGRFLMWQSALPIAGDAGPVGYGPGSFKLLLPFSEHFVPALYRHWIVTPYIGQQPTPVWCHAHNEYLQATVEWGWIGALLLIALVWVPALRLCRIAWNLKLQQHREGWLVTGLAGGLIGVLLHAGIDIPMQSPVVAVSVALLAGIGWGLNPAARTQPVCQLREAS